jgi:hypothetical protein
MTNIESMSLLALSLVVAGLPERRVLWTRFEHAAAAEYDHRVALMEAEASS